MRAGIGSKGDWTAQDLGDGAAGCGSARRLTSSGLEGLKGGFVIAR